MQSGEGGQCVNPRLDVYMDDASFQIELWRRCCLCVSVCFRLMLFV